MATSLEATLETSKIPKLQVKEIHYKPDPEKKMLAVEWRGNREMKVVERPRPTITEPRDVIVRTTASTICGSDLHLYHAEFQGLEKGDILGHEAVGIVEQIGPDVKNFKPGDKVVISAVISCGDCFYCNKGQMSLCLNTNPNPGLDEIYGHRLSGIFGYSHLLGGFEGCQAEYVRVPIGDVNLLHDPKSMDDSKLILLSDILCTSWHANELAEVQEGDTVAVWGCGPVGLLTQMWAKFRGAKRVFGIDNIPTRLEMAQKHIGSEIIDFSKQDVLATLHNLVPLGPDVCIEACGFRYSKTVTHKIQRALAMETDTADILTEVFKSVRKGGRVSIVGDYYALCNQFPIGAMMEKGLTIRGSQVYVQKYWKQLLQYLQEGKVDPSFVITQEMPLEKADEAYRIFDAKEKGVVKILLRPSRELRR